MTACGRPWLAVCACLAVPVVVLSAVPALQFDHWPWICLTLAAPAVVAGGLPLHRDAGRALRHGGLDDDLPALLAVVGALAWSVVALLHGPAGDPGWTQAFPPAAAGPPVRLDVAAAIAVLLVAAALRTRVDDPRTPGWWAGRAGRAVVPLVLAVAAGTLGYRLGAGDDAARAAAATAAVLLVAAPSALLPRIPRRAERVERRVDTVLFTSRALGGPRRIDAVRTVPETGEDEVLRLAGSVAELSEHPAARAIAAAAAERGEVPAVGEFDERPGLGASGIVAELHPEDDAAGPDLAAVSGPAGRRADGTAVTVVAHAVLLGHPDLLAEHDVAFPDELRTPRDEIEEAGHTAVAVAWDGRARAVLAVATDVPQDAAAAVAAVRRAGMTPALLSARPTAAATAVAGRAGIDPGPDSVLAGVRPDGAADAVAGLRGRGHVVAVAGGPGRDDAALAAADVALPVGAEDGAAAAVAALRRRRRRPGPAQWTVAAAVVYHLAALPVAASGMIDPLLAVLAGAVATVAATHRPGRAGRHRGAGAVSPVTNTPRDPLGDARPRDGS